MKNKLWIVGSLAALAMLIVGIVVLPDSGCDKERSRVVQQDQPAADVPAFIAKVATESVPAKKPQSSRDASAKPHGVGCSCSAHRHAEAGEQPETEKAAPVVMTPEMRAEILGHSKGQPITFTLPGGQVASGVVELTTVQNGRQIGVSGRLQSPKKGKFFFEKQTMPGLAGEFVGIVHFEEGEVAYMVEPRADGAAELREKHVDEVICRKFSNLPTAEAMMFPLKRKEMSAAKIR